MPSHVYRYFVLDEGAAHRSFECRADGDADAERQLAAAGIRDAVLYEVVAVDERLHDGPLAARLRHHPFLGPEWEPLVGLLDEATGRLDRGFWRVQVIRPVAAEWGGSAPFAQAVRREDGTTQVEIGGAPVAEGLDGRRRLELDFFGWQPPRPDEGLPLPYLILGAEWSGRAIAQRVVEALAVVYDIGPDHRFAFEGVANGLADSGRYDFETVADGVYLMIGPAEEEWDEEFDDDVDLAADDEPDEDDPDEALRSRVAARSGGVALPPTVDEQVAEWMAEMLDAADLGYPYVPTMAGVEVDELMGSTFGTFRRPFAPPALQSVEELLGRIMEGDWSPRLRFGPERPGERSRFTYELVRTSLAVIIQVDAVADGDESAAAERRTEWAHAMAWTRELARAYRDDGDATARDGIIVLVWSPTFAGVKLVTWDDLPDHGEPARVTRKFARRDAGSPPPTLMGLFQAAERWLHRGRE